MTLRVSKTQVRTAGEQQFVEAIATYLRLQYPDTTRGLPDLEMFRCIRIGLRKAERYGVLDERGQVTFLDLMFTVSPNFDEHSKVHAVLTDESAAFPPVLDRLDTAIGLEEWDRIKTSSTSAWGR